MKFIRNFLSKHNHFYILGLLLFILLWFKYLELNIVPRYITFSSLDVKIPFIKEFVIPYLLWFPYIAYGIIYTGIYSRREFYRLFLFLAAGMSVACIAYTIYPNGQDLRPQITQNDIFSVLVKIVYSTDTPTNVCPSIHVINSIAVNSALWNTETFSSKKFGKLISLIFTVIICLSTVFIKQHSIVDVVWGIVAAFLVYISLYKTHYRKAYNFFRNRYARRSQVEK